MITNEWLGLSLFGTVKHGKPDCDTLKPIAAVKPIVYPRPDGKVSFDKPSSVFLSNTNHEEDQPVHLRPARSGGADSRQPAPLRRAGAALLPGRRLRSRLRRRGQPQGSALRHQRAELRPLQNLRHQGPGAEHRLDDAGGRRRTKLPGHVSGPERGPKPPRLPTKLSPVRTSYRRLVGGHKPAAPHKGTPHRARSFPAG